MSILAEILFILAAISFCLLAFGLLCGAWAAFRVQPLTFPEIDPSLLPTKEEA